MPPPSHVRRAFSANVELTLRVVDEDEGRALNRSYRERDYATNVLSFPADGLADIAPDLLGDIVLCAPVVAARPPPRASARPTIGRT